MALLLHFVYSEHMFYFNGSVNILTILQIGIISVAMAKTAGIKVRGERGYFPDTYS
jgi:hypothetical protein